MPSGSSLAEPAAWYAGLPGVVIAAGALITNSAEQVLLVKPNYRDHWTLPGGICEFGEPPDAGCAREVTEELGLQVPIGPLLSIDWSRPFGSEERPIMHFVFDGGQLPERAPIELQHEELDDYTFIAATALADYLAPHALPRVTAAVAARAAGTAFYVPQIAG